MPTPTTSDLHVNGPLTQMSIQYKQDREGFIADLACPTCKVDKQTDIFPVWSKADFFRMQARKVADEAPTPVGAVSLDLTQTYHCDRYGLKKLITKNMRSNSDIDIDQGIVNFLTEQILIARDYAVISKLLVEANWTIHYDGVTATPTGTQFLHWHDSAATPFVDVRTINTALKASCGHRATHLLVTSDVDDALREHPDAVDKVKYTQTGIVTPELLASAFGVKHYLVADAIYNTAAEGLASSTAFMATNCALLYYAPDAPTRDTPSSCYNFSWSDFDQVPAGDGATISSWNNDDPTGEWLKAEMFFEPKITAADAGIFMAGVVT